ncbi:unnamed protein product [Fraxinus pennsylvanica]|uniref:F-box domain-containing protein n=1 Tax=Fraxinus pennsylvanica TaxID=56036 RepID=A0AAD2ADN5_9LAMI|nr:unnamed protein product [Fraxinus pennsylvanica]
MRSTSSFEDAEIQTLTLIPGLPNDLGALILAFIPYSHHSRIKSTCKSWKRILRFPLRICLTTKISAGAPFRPCPVTPMSFPLDRPSPSSSAFRFDFMTFSWDSLSPMITPRGSFACAALPDCKKIVVAGGGSRHTMFGAAGSRMSSVEMYDIGKDEWVALDGLPRFRAGCVGFFLGRREFWVMGGYGESRTVSGVFPVDEYYRDAVVMELKNGGKWRELGDMWEEGERRRLGKIVVVEDEGQDVPEIFMLDKSEIFRYDMASNHWIKETSVPKKASDDSSVGFVALDGELHLLTLLNGNDSPDSRRSRQHKRILDEEEQQWMRMGHLVLRSLHTRLVGPPSPNGCTWVGGSNGKPCQSSVSEKNFAGHIVATPPPPLATDHNAYLEQMVQFGMVIDRI